MKPTIIQELEKDKQTRIEIYEYIKQKYQSYPEIFMDARLHKYFTEDLVPLKTSISAISTAIRKCLDEIKEESIPTNPSTRAGLEIAKQIIIKHFGNPDEVKEDDK